MYDEEGRADLYRNYIIGAAYKYYDYQLLKDFFNYLKTDNNHEFYEQLFWIGLENSIYHKAENDRPVLKSLRSRYSKKVLNGEIPLPESEILKEIKKAHYKRVLGEAAIAEARVLTILDELEFDEHMNTEQIIFKMNEIIKKYFKFRAGTYQSLKEQHREMKKPSAAEPSEKHEEKKEDSGYSLMKDLTIESAETTRLVFFEQNDKLKMKNLDFHELNGRGDLADRD